MTEEINNMINKFCDSVEKRINQYELEKENAELKDYSQRMENQRENYYKEYLALKQEKRKLEEINEALMQEAEDIAEARMEICNQCGNRDDYNIPCKMIRDLDYALTTTVEERDTYRKALEEIQQTAIDAYSKGTFNSRSEGLKEIEKLINEVLNDT